MGGAWVSGVPIMIGVTRVRARGWGTLLAEVVVRCNARLLAGNQGDMSQPVDREGQTARFERLFRAHYPATAGSYPAITPPRSTELIAQPQLPPARVPAGARLSQNDTGGVGDAS